MFGNPETTTGGRALKFYASIRLDIRRIQSIKDGDRVVGSRTRAKVVKNKVAAPFREAEFDIIYGEGISRRGRSARSRRRAGISSKRCGTWISCKGERLGQGRENARLFLKEHTDIRDKIEHELRKSLGLSPLASSPDDAKKAAAADGDKPPAKTAVAAGQARAAGR